MATGPDGPEVGQILGEVASLLRAAATYAWGEAYRDLGDTGLMSLAADADRLNGLALLLLPADAAPLAGPEGAVVGTDPRVLLARAERAARALPANHPGVGELTGGLVDAVLEHCRG